MHVPMRKYLLVTSLFLLYGGIATQAQQAASADFGRYFQPMKKIGDTLFFSLTEPRGMRADIIPYAVFTTNIDVQLQQNIDYLLDPEETSIVGLSRFALNDEYDAYIIGVTVYWFGNQSLLIVNKKLNYVTALIPVSQFYGGDGGQVLRNTWFFDYNGDGKKDLLIRDSAHALRTNEAGEMEDSYEEFVSLYLWQSDGFKPAKLSAADETRLIRRFPIDWDW